MCDVMHLDEMQAFVETMLEEFIRFVDVYVCVYACGSRVFYAFLVEFQ